MIDILGLSTEKGTKLKDLKPGETFIYDSKVYELTNDKMPGQYVCLEIGKGILEKLTGDEKVEPKDFVMLTKEEFVYNRGGKEPGNEDEKGNDCSGSDNKSESKSQKSPEEKRTSLQQKKEEVKDMTHQEKKKFLLLEFLRKTCELKHWPRTLDIDNDPKYYNWSTFHNMFGSKSNICDIIRHKLIPKDEQANNVHRQFLQLFVEETCQSCEHYEEGASCSEYGHPGLCFKEMVEKKEEKKDLDPHYKKIKSDHTRDEKKKIMLLNYLTKACELRRWPKTEEIDEDDNLKSYNGFYNYFGSKSHIQGKIRYKVVPKKEDDSSNVDDEFLNVIKDMLCQNCKRKDEDSQCLEYDHPGYCFREMVKEEKKDRNWGFVGIKNNYKVN